MPAQETRWPSDGNRLISMPISETITWAARVLTPGVELSCLTAVRKGAISASTCWSISAMAASRASICLRCRRSRKRCCLVTRPRRAAHSCDGDAFRAAIGKSGEYETVRQQVGVPFGVADVGLAAGHILAHE